MRFRSLSLERFGRFEDVVLTFDPAAALHVVHGPNEAGKSTALRAITAFLFGIPAQTPDDFRHGYASMRVGAEITARDGRMARFTRRKGKGDTLLDPSGTSCPEQQLAALLGGAGLELFQTLFGLDQGSLRRGGKALQMVGGEVGASLFQAGSGVNDIRKLQKELDAKALAAFSRSPASAFRSAKTEFEAARRACDEGSVQPQAWQALRSRRDEAEARLKELGQDRLENDAKLRRVGRLLRTVPHLRDLQASHERFAELGPPPALPTDAEAQLQAATQARVRGEIVRESGMAALAKLDSELSELPQAAGLIAHAEAIRALGEKRIRSRAAEVDRVRQQSEVVQAEGQIVRLARELSLDGTATAALARVPGQLARKGARGLIADHARLDEKRQESQRRADQAAQDLGAARANLEAVPGGPAPHALADAIEAVRAEGPLIAEHERARRAHGKAQERLHEAMARLSPWTGTAEALAATAVPSPETIGRHSDAAKHAGDTAQARTRELADLTAQARAAAFEMQRLAHGRTMPTQAAIAAVRTERDAALGALRRSIEAGKASGAAELTALAALIQQADALADQRNERTADVTRFEQAEAQHAALQPLIQAADEAANAAQQQQATTEAAWRAEWHGLGFEPLLPGEMLAWRRERDEVLARLDAVRIAEEHALTAAGRIAQARSSLLDAHAGLPGDAELPALLAAAAEAYRTADAAQQRHKAAVDAVARAEALAAPTEPDRIAAEADLRRWQGEWDRCLVELSLVPGTTPGRAAAALDLWAEIDALGAQRAAAAQRIAEMDALVAEFEAEAASLLHDLAPDLPETGAAIAQLAERLAQEEADAVRRTDLLRQKADAAETVAQAHREIAAAAAQLARLCADAGLDNPAALPGAIAQAAEHASATVSAARAMALAKQQGDGLGLDRLLAEADGAELEALHREKDILDDEQHAIQDQHTVWSATAMTARGELEALERGTDAAHHAQRARDAGAEMCNAAREHLRYKLASLLLTRGIEQFRNREQGPLLEQASRHFATLTGGQYRRLLAEEGDDGPVFRAVPRIGRDLGVKELSEGTLDQLYFALRIAAVGQYASVTEPLPFIADDLLVNFDEERSGAAIDVLIGLGALAQPILFTHHEHVVALAERRGPASVQVHRLPA